MRTFASYLNEAKYAGKKMHFFTADDGKKLEGLYVDAVSEEAARKKVDKYLHGRKSEVNYVGLETYDRQGRIL